MSQTRSDLRGVHDLLVENLTAAGKSHAVEKCGFCISQDDLEEPVADPKYTEEQHAAAVKAAVDEAVAAARTEAAATISDLQKAQHAAAIAAAVAEATEASAAEVSRLQAELDAKTLEAAAEKASREALETAQAEALAAAERAAEIATLRDERAAAVREIAKFDGVEELVTASADRWAAMTDEDFAVVTDGLKAVVAKVPAPTNRPIPRAATAMTASEEAAPATGASSGSVLRDIRDARYGARTAV